jgi:hypothetical protein
VHNQGLHIPIRPNLKKESTQTLFESIILAQYKKLWSNSK